jgi:hypothetical protein
VALYSSLSVSGAPRALQMAASPWSYPRSNPINCRRRLPLDGRGTPYVFVLPDRSPGQRRRRDPPGKQSRPGSLLPAFPAAVQSADRWGFTRCRRRPCVPILIWPPVVAPASGSSTTSPSSSASASATVPIGGQSDMQRSATTSGRSSSIKSLSLDAICHPECRSLMHSDLDQTNSKSQ